MNFKRAKTLQLELAKKVIRRNEFVFPPKYVLGLDISYSKGKAVACCVILNYNSLRVIEIRYIIDDVKIPYVPTFLAFRELPFYTYLCYDFKGRRDIVALVDGHGLAHPRKLGIASHLGVVLDIPTVGVAKKILSGSIVRVNEKKYLKVNGETVGVIIRHKSFSPIYVSIGNKVSLETAENIVKHSIREHKLPLPIYYAHTYSRRIAKRL